MSGPKHLWSGDWERESAESRRRRARPEPGPEPAVSPFAPPPERVRAPARRRRRRLGAAVAALVVGIAGVAYAAVAIGGSRSTTTVAVGEGATAPLTVPTPTHQFSVPTTPTIPTTPSGATPTTPALGGSAQPIKWLGMEIVRGGAGEAVVDTVNLTGAGGQAGINPGDVIEGIAGRTVAGPQSIAKALTGLHAGLLVPIEVIRGSTYVTLEIRLGSPPHRYP